MNEVLAWARITEENICVAVEMATQEWVDDWTAQNPGSSQRYVPTDPNDKGYAGIGYSLDEETGRFIPPDPGVPGAYFDRDLWEWVIPDPEPTPEPEPEPEP